ncbi:MAG: carboxymuconolactone decarboxylase family protein [Pseudomonadales bacterium]|nr:carboxymuconolactone decarboxylase family protein [Pseudomonadales bacterium]
MSSTAPAPRVPLLSKEEARKRAAEVGLAENFAELNVFRMMLQHPVLAGKVGSLLSMLLFEGNKFDPRQRELIIMRLGWVSGSEYEWTAHWNLAIKMEMSEEEILAVQDWQNSTILSDNDKTVLKATDEMVERGAITATTWKQLETFIKTEEEKLELVIAICNWRMFSQLLLSLEVPSEESMESWPPLGELPSAALAARHRE